MNGKVTVDQLAQVIRTVDGGHSLGAAALAEAILEALPNLQSGAKPEAVRLRDELRERAEQSGLKLPTLPVSRGFIQWHAPQALHQALGFTSTQMQDYALAAIAATDKQQVGELQGDALKALVQEMDKFRTTWTTVSMREFGYFVDKMKAALAARQPAGE